MTRRLATLFSALAVCACALTLSVFAQRETRYTVLLTGKTAGVQTSNLMPDGAREFTFEYSDRGRGPKLTTTIKLDAAGLPVSLDTTGNDYLKAPVAETFTFEQGVARWKNTAESGEKRLNANAFYNSMNGAPEEFALLAQALLKSPNRRLPLLPDGEASIERTGELTLKDGDKERRVVSYEVSGLGFTPSTVWLGEDGSFFATVSSWLSVIREGWESSQPVLLKKQDELEAVRTTKLARTLARKPTSPLAFTGATLFDAETGKTIPNTTVVIVGNRIKAVGRAGKVSVPKDAEVIDARGRVLMPGLWDMHVHIGPNDGLMHVAAGVTSVRDMANDTEALLALRARIDAGEEIGPRILMAGIMDGRGPYAGPTKVLVDTEEEARAAVDTYARLGYSQVKIYSSVKPELVPAIIARAHERGLRVSGHVPAFMTAEQFVRAGADEFQHINFFVLNFLFDEVKDTRTPVRFTAVADRAATISLSDPRVRALVRLLKERKTVVDPTVNVFEAMFTDRPGQLPERYATLAERLPPQVRRYLLGGGLPVPEGKDERYLDSEKALLRMIKMLYDAGVTLVAGTDATPGFALHRELELYAEAGIPAPDVLRIATLGAARVMKRDAELGSVAPGKLADIILIDGDPTRRIADLDRVSLVVKDGNVYDTGALYKTIGVRP
ncbi:MAG TPA: amidohydrolase family protein [Pyrinomonadaceae bacterium]|jgi:imidazolonepropionase-like amidohydrolase|nr:amidohydrolase family protein [Pyrinomonadaceae bacterium]